MTTTECTPIPTENRQSFFGRLRPFMAPSDLLKVEIAYAMSKFAHRWQTRKELDSDGEPIRYFEHLRSVALNLIDELGIVDPDLIISCLMHDSLEDTQDITEAMLEHLFGKVVVMTVKLVTKTPENKARYYDILVTFGDPKAWIVKGCDRLHNLRTLKGCTPEFRQKQVDETVTKILPIMRRLSQTPGYEGVGQKLYHLIESQLYIVLAQG